MDKLKFNCIHCGVLITVKASFAGKKGKCPSCKQLMDIPLNFTDEEIPQDPVSDLPPVQDGVPTPREEEPAEESNPVQVTLALVKEIWDGYRLFVIGCIALVAIIFIFKFVSFLGVSSNSKIYLKKEIVSWSRTKAMKEEIRKLLKRRSKKISAGLDIEVDAEKAKIEDIQKDHYRQLSVGERAISREIVGAINFRLKLPYTRSIFFIPFSKNIDIELRYIIFHRPEERGRKIPLSGTFYNMFTKDYAPMRMDSKDFRKHRSKLIVGSKIIGKYCYVKQSVADSVFASK